MSRRPSLRCHVSKYGAQDKGVIHGTQKNFMVPPTSKLKMFALSHFRRPWRPGLGRRAGNAWRPDPGRRAVNRHGALAQGVELSTDVLLFLFSTDAAAGVLLMLQEH